MAMAGILGSGAEDRQIKGKLLVVSVPSNEPASAAVPILGTLAVGYFQCLHCCSLPIGIV